MLEDDKKSMDSVEDLDKEPTERNSLILPNIEEEKKDNMGFRCQSHHESILYVAEKISQSVVKEVKEEKEI